MKKKIEKMVEKITTVQVVRREELTWLQKGLFDCQYDEDTDLVYLMGLNIVPIMLAVTIGLIIVALEIF